MALSPSRSSADSQGRELVRHGTTAFPIACYDNDMSQTVVPWHWHEEMEAGVILEGSAVFAAGQERCVLSQGEGFFLNAGTLHRCWNGVPSCRFISMVFHPRLVGGSLDSVIYQNYVQPLLDSRSCDWLWLKPEVSWQADILAKLEDAWQACVQEPAGFEIRTRNLLSETVLLLSGHLPVEKTAVSPKAVRDAERIKTMLQFIHDNYAEDIKLDQIAASAAVSESECIRCFRSTIEATPIQYIRQYRIRKAAQMLADTEEKISAICFSCGFQDISYFAKSFREIMGCTPTEYRQKKQSEEAT
ncbi:MAG: AraC family transcriptional regulator [Faecousia sp.]